MPQLLGVMIDNAMGKRASLHQLDNVNLKKATY